MNLKLLLSGTSVAADSHGMSGGRLMSHDPKSVRTMGDLLHAVRNSLNLILGYAHLLHGGLQPGSEPLQVICRESEWLAQLLALVPEGLDGVDLHRAARATSRGAGGS
jgi:hypothetical protein